MSTNLVPVSLVSQFLANEKMASRYWLQCQMECLLDQVFDQLSTKFEDYLASNAITGTAHHTTIDTDHIQHQHRHEPSFQVHSHTQFQATTDHLINTLYPVGQSQNRCQMMNVNEQVNPNDFHSGALMFDQAQYPHLLSVATSNLEQNYEHGLVRDEDQTLNENIGDDADRVNSDEVNVKEEIDDSINEIIASAQPQYPHLLSVPISNLELSNQIDDEVDYGLDGDDGQPPNENDDASLVDRDEIEVKEEVDDSNNELITSNQNSQIAQSVFASASNEQSNHNWTSENDEEYDLDGTRNDEQLNGLEYGDFEDDTSQVDSDEVEVKQEIDDSNNQLTNELHQNSSLPAPTPNVEQSNKNGDDDDDDGLDDQQPNEHLRDGNDEMNEPNEVPSRPRKKPRLETTQPNSRQSMRHANRNQTDQVQYINEQNNFDRSQSNEQTEQTEEEEETNEVDNQDRRIIALRVQCHQTGCPLMFNNKTELNAHMRTQHGILLHRCVVKDCKQSFSNMYNLGEHVKQVHPNTTQWHCDKCPKHFPANRQLVKHNYNFHQLGQYQCAFSNCTMAGEHRQKVFNHYNQQHKQKPTFEFTCHHPNCGRTFNVKGNFKVHQQAHLGIKPYRCKWPNCDFAATTCGNTIGHIKRMHLTKHSKTNEQPVDPREYLEVLRDHH